MPNEWNLGNLGIQLRPVTVQVDGVQHEMLYGATEPEYVGRMPLRTDLEILPLPPDRDSQDDFNFMSNLPPPDDDSYGGHALEIRAQSATGTPEAGQVLVANSWGSAWGPPPEPTPQHLEANSNGGLLYINGAPLSHDILFYTKDRVEALRIGENGDFFVQGRLVKNDLQIYHAFRMFLGMTMGRPPEPGSRDGIPTRYERILKKSTEDQ